MQKTTLFFLISIASGSFINMIPALNFDQHGLGLESSLRKRAYYAKSVDLPKEKNEPIFNTDLFNHMFSEGFR